MKVAILGFGLQGRSAYEYWSKKGNEVTICDGNKRIKLPKKAKSQLGPNHLKNLDQYDLIVRSPIVHPNSIVENNSPDTLKKVTSNTNEFFKACPTKNIIGVTGTKGKGTTSTLIATILEKYGKKVHLGGNIGTPPLEMLKDGIKRTDWVVLELANFQLIDLKRSPMTAVCLTVADEHLDWHKDSREYIEAKQQLFRWQGKNDLAIYYAHNPISAHIASISKGHKMPFMKYPGADVIEGYVTIEGHRICSIDEMKLPGQHNWQNICAAVTVAWQVMQDVNALRQILRSFKGLPFRIELRREVNGVRYYNDSFASGPGSAKAAIESIRSPKVMLIGGYDRGNDLNDLIDGVIENEDNIRKVVLYGASAKHVADELKKARYENFVIDNSSDMKSLVKTAAGLAKKGDAVILSPAFASFDMFSNFEERGTAFNEAVEKL